MEKPLLLIKEKLTVSFPFSLYIKRPCPFPSLNYVLLLELESVRHLCSSMTLRLSMEIRKERSSMYK